LEDYILKGTGTKRRWRIKGFYWQEGVATQREYDGELFTNAKDDINRAKIISRKIIDEL